LKLYLGLSFNIHVYDLVQMKKQSYLALLGPTPYIWIFLSYYTKLFSTFTHVKTRWRVLRTDNNRLPARFMVSSLYSLHVIRRDIMCF